MKNKSVFHVRPMNCRKSYNCFPRPRLFSLCLAVRFVANRTQLHSTVYVKRERYCKKGLFMWEGGDGVIAPSNWTSIGILILTL